MLSVQRTIALRSMQRCAQNTFKTARKPCRSRVANQGKNLPCVSTRTPTFFRRNSSTGSMRWPATTRTWVSACALLPCTLRHRCAQEDRGRPQGLSANPCRTRSRRSKASAKNPADIDEFCRIINDGFAELCAKEKGSFPGWVGHVSACSAGCRRCRRSGAGRQKTRCARRAEIYTNVKGKPIDLPEYLPFWDKVNEFLGIPVWMHPTRGAETPDYIS